MTVVELFDFLLGDTDAKTRTSLEQTHGWSIRQRGPESGEKVRMVAAVAAAATGGRSELYRSDSVRDGQRGEAVSVCISMLANFSKLVFTSGCLHRQGRPATCQSHSSNSSPRLQASLRLGPLNLTWPREACQMSSNIVIS